MKANKVRWYKAELKLPFFVFAERLNAANYSDKEGWGFELDIFRKNYLEGFYFEKNTLEMEIQNPLGEIEKYRTVNYTRFFFSAAEGSSNSILLTLRNPPRSTKKFIQELSRLAGDSFFIAAVKFDLRKLYLSILEDHRSSSVLVRSISVNSIPFTENSIARFEILSKKDAYEDLISEYPDSSFALEKMRIEIHTKTTNESIELSNSGTITCTKEAQAIVNPYISEIADAL